MKSKLNPYWVFSVVIKILIPVMFFVVANVENVDVANAISGAMVIFTLAYYLLNYLKVNQNKYTD